MNCVSPFQQFPVVEDVKVRRVRFEEQSGDRPDNTIVKEYGDITFQERFRECTVDRVVGQQHFAESSTRH